MTEAETSKRVQAVVSGFTQDYGQLITQTGWVQELRRQRRSYLSVGVWASSDVPREEGAADPDPQSEERSFRFKFTCNTTGEAVLFELTESQLARHDIWDKIVRAETVKLKNLAFSK